MRRAQKDQGARAKLRDRTKAIAIEIEGLESLPDEDLDATALR